MRVQRSIKRAIDVLIGSLLLLIAAPLIAVCALSIAASSPGAAIFRQRRVGLHGKPFAMFKLRTMYADSDAILARHLASDARARDEWQRFHRLADDPRVIRGIGQWMRRSSIDELPQLWNVVIGDMSLVGPRPLETMLAERLSDADHALRHSVRPGLTGLWQVSGRSEGEVHDLLTRDVEYVAGWSLWRDVIILARTPAAVLSRRGAF